jgi:uncharacterized membrane protein YtjA (UPF0391 family)
MLGWSLVFLVVAAIAAFLGFGGVATTMAGVAQITFFIAVVLLLISLALGFLPRERVAGGVRGLGVLAIGAVIGIGVYLWMDNDMSAEQVGRSIDRGAVELASSAEDAADRAGAVVQDTINDTRDETADVIESDATGSGT